MSSLSIPRRLAKLLYNSTLQLAGRDPITYRPVVRRKDLRRLGTPYGGWTIPAGALSARSVCYCAGCGEDISFDLALIDQFHCDVFAFDPTPRAIQYVKANTGGNSHYHFNELGLWDKKAILKFFAPSNPQHVSHSLLNLQHTADYIEVPVERLSTIMRANQHEQLDLLKIDIEGAEYKVLDSVLADGLKIRVLCVEFDEYWHPLDSDYVKRIRSYVQRLLSFGYVIVDAPGNGNYTFLRDCLS